MASEEAPLSDKDLDLDLDLDLDDLDDLLGGLSTTAKDLVPPSPEKITTEDEGEKKENDGKSSSSSSAAAEAEAEESIGDNGIFKEMAGAEAAVSTAFWSTFSAVSDTLNITSTTTDAANKEKEKSGEIRLSDEDLDAMMTTENPATTDEGTSSTTEGTSITAAESVVSTAFWSTVTSVSDTLNTAATAATAATTITDPTSSTTTNKDQPTDVSSSISNDTAAAETSVSSALWSTFNSVSDTLNTTANTLNTTVANISATDNDKEESDGTEQQQESNSSSAANIWSTISAVSGSTTIIAESTSNTASSILKLYNAKVNRASGWIENLERERNEKDPHKRIRNHLEQYISTNPDSAIYEEWIGLWLSQEGWDHEDKNDDDKDGGIDTTTMATTTIKVDKTYYAKDSVHLKIWNERNYSDGIDISDKNPIRAYINVGNVDTATTAAAVTQQEQQIPDEKHEKEEEGEYVIEFGTNEGPTSNDTTINPTKDGLGEIGVLEK